MIDHRREAYRRATELDDRTAAELQARARETIGAGGGSRLGWGPLAIAAGAVLATVALGVRLAPRGDVPASLPIEHVSLEIGGVGTVGGTREAPIVDWVEGTLAVAVTPHQGVELTVSTPEATIRVVGTAFTVDRTRRATRVVVTEGTVRVTCAGGTESPVSAGAEQTCLPADPASLLMRLAELNRAGASAEERLETATVGLAAVDARSPVRAELLAHRTRALADAGQIDEALASAEAYLGSPDGPRKAELVSFVARTRYEREGCGAVPALERAVEVAPPGPESVLLASCLVDSDPARAATLIQGAGSWASGEWLEAVADVRARLGAAR